MHQISDARLEHQRRRFTRHDAQRWWRCDAARYRRFDPQFQRGRSTVDRKAYNPDQPREPAGSAEGGQWTGGDGETPVRLASTERPPGRGAGLRFAQQLALGLIKTYRKENLLNDFFGDEKGTVAVTRVNDKFVFGVNSGLPTYSDRDEAAARELRDTMLEKYPDVMKINNIGEKPNDAVFHAEATVLLRAARENGGTLEGKSLMVFVDRPICDSCRTLLPYIGFELGNPTVTFIDRRGFITTLRNRSWD